jgi:hypothetical protein
MAGKKIHLVVAVLGIALAGGGAWWYQNKSGSGGLKAAGEANWGNMAKAIDRPLPAKVAEKTKHHIADSLAAIVSGTKLFPGRKGIEYVSTQGGVAQATVMGTTLSSSVTLAAFANAMSAHADETDELADGFDALPAETPDGQVDDEDYEPNFATRR